MPSAANPPLAVSATLNTASGRVLISWDPSAAGGATVTGYRIYYNADNTLNNVPVDGTLVQFELVHTLPVDDMMISIRAESAQLPSELITVNVLRTSPITTSVSELTTTSVMATTTFQTSIAIPESFITAIETSTMVIVAPSTITPAPVGESTSTMVIAAASTTTTEPAIATMEPTMTPMEVPMTGR